MKNQIKERNVFAIHAWNKTGAGYHTDRKKQKNKNACRKKYRHYQEQ